MKIVLVVSVVWISISTSTAAENDKNSKIPPVIETKWQESGSTGWFYEDEDFDDGISFGGEEIVVASTVTSFLITCSASYPVQWTYNNAEESNVVDLYSSRGRISPQMYRYTGENYNFYESYKFYSYLQFQSGYGSLGRKITGNYTCRSLSDDGLGISRFVFKDDSYQNMVYGEISFDERKNERNTYSYGETRKCTTPSCNNRPSKTVKADPNNQTVFLPCGVVSPEIPVILFKRTALKNLDYEEINITAGNDSITFDPKYGFVLKVQELSSPYGIYKCVPRNPYRNINESLIINVTKGVSLPLNGPENNILEENAKFYFDNSSLYDSSIICCASSPASRPPKIYKTNCATKFECRNLRMRLLNFEYLDRQASSYSARTLDPNCQSTRIDTGKNSGVFRCVGDGIDVTREYFYTPAYRPSTSFHYGYNSRAGGHHYQNHGHTVHFGKNYSELHFDDDISKFSKEDFVLITTNRGEIIDSTLYAIYSNLIGTEQSTELRCHGSTYFFANGVRWSIIWKNQTEQLMPVAATLRSDSQPDFYSMSKLDLNITQDMAAIICHAPLYDSWDWVNKTLQINGTDPVLPKIDGPSEETLIWSLGETNKEIVCIATNGIPIPTLSWKFPWDASVFGGGFDFGHSVEKSLRWNKEVLNYEGNTTVKFQRVIEGMNGKYICEAENNVGETSKTFVVTFQDKNSQTTARTTQTSFTIITTASTTTMKQLVQNRTTQGARAEDTTAKISEKLINKSESEVQEQKSASGSNANNRGLHALLGILVVAILCCGIGILFLVMKNRKQQKSLERLKNISYHHLTEISSSNPVAINANDEDNETSIYE